MVFHINYKTYFWCRTRDIFPIFNRPSPSLSSSRFSLKRLFLTLEADCSFIGKSLRVRICHFSFAISEVHILNYVSGTSGWLRFWQCRYHTYMIWVAPKQLLSRRYYLVDDSFDCYHIFGLFTQCSLFQRTRG